MTSNNSALPFEDISVEQLKYFVDTSANNILLLGSNLVIEAASSALCGRLDKPADAVTGRRFNTIWPLSNVPVDIEALVADAFAGIPGTCEKWMSLFWPGISSLRFSALPQKCRDVKAAYVIIAIVENKRQENSRDKLRNTNKFISSLPQNTGKNLERLLIFIREQWNAVYAAFQNVTADAPSADIKESGTINTETRSVLLELLSKIDRESDSGIFSVFNADRYSILTAKISSGQQFYGVLIIVLPNSTVLSSEDECLLEVLAAVLAAQVQRETMRWSLLKSRQQLEFLFESVPMQTMLVDRDLMLYYVNDTCGKEFGYKPEELIGKTILQLYRSEDHNMIKEQIKGSFEHPAKWFTWVTRRLGKDGLLRWMKDTARIFKDPEDLGLLLIIGEDITEIRLNNERTIQLNQQLEQRVLERTEALRRSEEKFRSLFESMHDVFFIIEMDGIISEISPAVELYSEKSREEIIGTSIRDGYFIDNRQIDKIVSEILAKEEIFDYEMCFNGVNNLNLYVSCNARVIKGSDGQVLRVEGSFRDITDRKAAENAILKKVRIEEFLANVSTRFINLSLAEIDKTIVSTLRLMARFTESDAIHIVLSETVKDKPKIMCWSAKPSCKSRAGFHSQSANIILPHMLSRKMFSPVFVRSTGDMSYSDNIIYNFLRSHGIYSALLLPIGYRNTNVGYIGFYSLSDIPGWMGGDVSFLNILAEIYSNLFERKKIEEELIAAKMLAEESSRAKEIFLAHMSHEFRTPLNAIAGSLNLIKKTDSVRQTKKLLETISVSADSLLALVNDVLDFSRIRAQKLTLDPANFSLKELLSRVMQIAREQAERKKIKLLVKIPKDVPATLYGDSHRLMQVLTNIVSNAVKFTDTGYIELAVNVLSRDSDIVNVAFSVKDTGIGIPRNMLDEIFRDFVQVKKRGEKERGGSGLGLTICKSLVSLMGGSISVESTLDVGSTFFISIPFTTAKAFYITGKAGTGLKKLEDLKGCSVLVVEDNEFNRKIVCHYLLGWKAKCTFAESAESALNLLKRQSFNIILLDIGLPGMDGYELARVIRRKFKPPICGMPIIALTAAATDDEKMKAIDAGINDFLTKPFSENGLYTKICAVLSKADAGIKSAAGGKAAVGSEKIHLRMPVTKYFIPQRILEKRHLTDAFLLEIIGVFTESAPLLLSELYQQITVSNYSEIKRLAHKAKSMYGFLHLTEAGDAFMVVEKYAAERKSINTIRRKFKIIEHMTMEIVAEMNRIMNYMNNGI